MKNRTDTALLIATTLFVSVRTVEVHLNARRIGSRWFEEDASPPGSKPWSGRCDCKSSELGRSC